MSRFCAMYVIPWVAVELGISSYNTIYAPRVLNVLRHWVEFHYYDFEREPELLEKLKAFVSAAKSKNIQKWVQSILRGLQKVCACVPAVSREPHTCSIT